MFRPALTFGLLCGLTAVAAPVPRTTNQDAKLIVGEWTAERWEYEGRSTTPNEVRHVPRVKVTDTSVTLELGPLAYPMEFALAPGKSLAHIDMAYSDGPNKGKQVLGVYELTGDMLTLCIAPVGGERPDKLGTKEGEQSVLYVLKRTKKDEGRR